MCVEVKKRTEVIAYKLFGIEEPGKIMGLCQPGIYRIGRLYTSKKGPGYQAFVTKDDALSGSQDFDAIYVYKVILHLPKMGIITHMSSHCDGKAGWVAKKMRIVERLSW